MCPLINDPPLKNVTTAGTSDEVAMGSYKLPVVQLISLNCFTLKEVGLANHSNIYVLHIAQQYSTQLFILYSNVDI